MEQTLLFSKPLDGVLMSSILDWDDYNIPENKPKSTTALKQEKPLEPKVTAPVAPVVKAVEAPTQGTPDQVNARTRLAAMALLGTDEEPFMGSERLKASDKKIVKGSSDVNQLIPFKYHWAWQKYLDGCANHWMPTEINMTRDLEQWVGQDTLSEDERRMVNRTLGFFSVADTMVANNLVQTIYNNVSAPEVRQYLLRQMFEEGLHSHSYQHILQSLRMDEGESFNMYREVPSIASKMSWALKISSKLAKLRINEWTTDNVLSDFIEGLAVYYCVIEGVFFYCGFAQILGLGRRNLLPSCGEQIAYILRDESGHAAFGIDLINEIKNENPQVWTSALQQRILDKFMEGYLLECDYIKDTIPNGILGMNYELHSQYLRFILNRRCIQIGLPTLFKEEPNPYPWMSEMMDLRKESNFFERRKMICALAS